MRPIDVIFTHFYFTPHNNKHPQMQVNHWGRKEWKLEEGSQFAWSNDDNNLFKDLKI